MKPGTIKQMKAIERDTESAAATMKPAEIEAAIASISDTLKKPGIHHTERLAMNAERHGLRAALAKTIGRSA